MKDKCYKTRKLILPPVNRSEVELLTPELEEAKFHLKECKECQSFFARQDELQRLIKDNLPKAKVPAIVREKILQKISKRNWKPWITHNKKLIKYSYAAIIILMLTSLLLFDPFNSNNSTLPSDNIIEGSGYKLTEELINDYIRYRISEQPAEFATNNPQELNNWFSRKVDFNARFLSVDELQLVGGRLCYLFDRRVALGFYSQKDMHKTDQWVSLFIFKDNHINLSKMKIEKLNDKTVWCGESRGYELTVWKQNDLLYALVADADCIGLAKKLLEKI